MIRSAGFLTAARAVSGLATLLILAVATRTLDRDEVGRFALAYSIAYLLVPLTDMGLTALIVRDVARQREAAGPYMGALVLLRVALAPVVFVALGLTVALVYDAGFAFVTVLAAASAYLQTFATAMRSFLVAAGRFGEVASLIVVENVVWFLALSATVVTTRSVELMFAVAIVVQAASLALSAGMARARLRPVGLVRGAREWRVIVRSSIGFGLVATLTAIHLQVDTVAIALVVPIGLVAVVNIATRTLLAADYAAESMSRVAFPRLSRSSIGDAAVFARQVTRLLSGLVTVGALIGCALFLIAPAAIPFGFGETYRDAVPLVQVLAAATPFRYLSAGLAVTLNVTGHQFGRAGVIAVSIAVGMCLDVALVVLAGLLGAGMAITISAIFTAGLLFGVARRGIGTRLPAALAFTTLAFPVGVAAQVVTAPTFPDAVVGIPWLVIAGAAVATAGAALTLRGATPSPT